MDRRWGTRKYLLLRVGLEMPSYSKQVLPASLLDIGMGGVFIETEVFLPTDTPIIIELKLPVNLSQNSFRLNARIVRRTIRGVGIAFVGMAAGVVHALSEALCLYEQQLEPLEQDILSSLVMHNKLPV
jgi:hypothetical protein